MRVKYTDRQFRDAWKQGGTLASAAKLLGCNEETARVRLSKLGLYRRRPEAPSRQWTPEQLESPGFQVPLGETLVDCAAGQAVTQPVAWLLVRPPGAETTVRIALSIEAKTLVIDAPKCVQVGNVHDVEAIERQAEESWWRPTVETGEFVILGQCARCHHYRLTFKTNQPLSRGQLEEALARGMKALHLAAGKMEPMAWMHENADDNPDAA